MGLQVRFMITSVVSEEMLKRSLNSTSDSTGEGEQVRYLHVFLICGSYNFNLAQTESNVQPPKLQNYSLGRDSI